MRRAMPSALVAMYLLFSVPPAPAAPPSADWQPDPWSVQRHGPAYRYPQAGWIVLHIEGEPYERGFQHGKLLAPEIAAYVRCFAALQSSKSPADGWRLTRQLVDALFLRRYEKEYLEEMKGIAEGASAAGARFEGRPIDLVDIVAVNAWAEVETLGSALDATPNGLEGLRLGPPAERAPAAEKADHCSAFAATGPATADGKIVFGHITMFGLYPSNYFNVWLDVKPAKGHRVVMQTYPGGIQSGLDYYLNDAGLLCCETTIRQTKFDVKGMALASRIRQALQYADGIDGAVEILAKDNNGLYTNEWLLGDIKTNEIAMFELGTKKTRLWRSSKNEWFGGTPGFYWGCNNVKDLDVRLDTLSSVHGKPANPVWHPSERDKMWLKLYQEHRGSIGADFGKLAFTTPPIAAYSSLDAKFTTTDMARELKSWALFGPPLGRTWQPTFDERQRYPEIRSLVSNPWTVLHVRPPTRPNGNGTLAIDLPDAKGKRDKLSQPSESADRETDPVWRGTVLPKSDADVWLAAAFADYERIVALERSLRRRSDSEKPSREVRERLSVALFQHRSSYLTAARAAEDVPLGKTKSAVDRDEWYRIAAGKGVLVLHELRQLLGDEAFIEMMDGFGREHAGKEVTTAEFRAHAEKVGGKKLEGFFDWWLTQPGLPVLQMEKPRLALQPPMPGGRGSGSYRTDGEIRREGKLPRAVVEVSLETASGATSQRLLLEAAEKPYELASESAPRRLVVDPYTVAAHSNGSVFGVMSFRAELSRTLIVAGTADEEAANREAAVALQEAIRRNGANITVPVRTDRAIKEEELKTHHLLLVGRPDCNRLTDRFRAALPVTFGSRSFAVLSDHYAHARSAVIAAGDNPLNRRFSVVVVAGLSAEATLKAADGLMKRGGSLGDVLILPHEASPRTLVAPAHDLVAELGE